MIKTKYFLIIIFLLILSGCRENENSKVKTDTLSKEKSAPAPIKQTFFKGMCSGTETFTECGSNKKFTISPDGENNELEKAVTFFSSKRPNQEFYIEVEGFPSVQERSKGNGFDTILVITRFIKLDMVRNCD